MAGHLDLFLKAAKLNPSPQETSKSADASHLLSSTTDSESAVASEQESSDGEFDVDEASCGEEGEQAGPRFVGRRRPMNQDLLDSSMAKRSKAMESHNENERKRRKSLKLSVLNLREQMNRKTRKPSTISILQAAQEEIQELKSREEREEKILDDLRKRNDVLTYLLQKQIDKAKKAHTSSGTSLSQVADLNQGDMDTPAKHKESCSEDAETTGAGLVPAPVVGPVPTPVVRPVPTPVVGPVPAPVVGQFPTPVVGSAPQIGSDLRLPMRSFWMAPPTVSSPASCSPLSVPLVPFFTPTTHPTTFLTHSNSAYPHPYYSYYNPSMSSFLPRHLPHPIPAISTGLPTRYLLPLNSLLSSSARPPVVSLANHNWKEDSHSPRTTEEEDSNPEEGNIGAYSKIPPVVAKCSPTGKEVSEPSLSLASLQTESGRGGNGHLQDPTATSAHMLGSPSPLPGVYSRKRRDSSIASSESKSQGCSELTKNYQTVQPQPFSSSPSSSYTPTPARNGYFSPSVDNFNTNCFSSRLKVASNSNTHTPMYYKVPPHTMWQCQLTAAKAQ